MHVIVLQQDMFFLCVTLMLKCQRYETLKQVQKGIFKLVDPCGFKTFAVFRMQSVFFWEFPRRLKFKSRRFGTRCRFHRPGRSGIKCVEAR